MHRQEFIPVTLKIGTYLLEKDKGRKDPKTNEIKRMNVSIVH